jgi:hypothetical protein
MLNFHFHLVECWQSLSLFWKALGTTISIGLVVPLPIVNVAPSVLVAAVSAKHAILAIATSTMANRMLAGTMLLVVVCGDVAAIIMIYTK